MLDEENRPYVGFIKLTIDVNDTFGYIIPLTNDKNHIYNEEHKYSYKIDYILDGEKKYSLLKINKLIPVLNNTDFIIEKDENRLSKQQRLELNAINSFRHIEEIYNLAQEIIEKRKEFVYREFAGDRNLLFSVDTPLAEQMAIDYAKSFYQPTLKSLVNSFEELNFPKELYERKYFLNDSDWVQQLHSNKIFWPQEAIARFASKKEFSNHLHSKIDHLLNKIKDYGNQLKYFQKIENNNLINYWFHKNEIVNKKSEFEGFRYKSVDKRTKEIRNHQIFASSKTKFYFENEDLLIWYGWNNTKWPQVVLLNKANKFATDMESIQYVSHLNTIADFKHFIFQMFLEKPKEFQTILEKYGYPQNRALFFERQITNIDQQLARKLKNPQMVQQLNQLKTLRQSQLEQANNEWQDYLQSKGIINQSAYELNVNNPTSLSEDQRFDLMALKQLNDIYHTFQSDLWSYHFNLTSKAIFAIFANLKPQINQLVKQLTPQFHEHHLDVNPETIKAMFNANTLKINTNDLINPAAQVESLLLNEKELGDEFRTNFNTERDYIHGLTQRYYYYLSKANREIPLNPRTLNRLYALREAFDEYGDRIVNNSKQHPEPELINNIRDLHQLWTIKPAYFLGHQIELSEKNYERVFRIATKAAIDDYAHKLKDLFAQHNKNATNYDDVLALYQWSQPFKVEDPDALIVFDQLKIAKKIGDHFFDHYWSELAAITSLKSEANNYMKHFDVQKDNPEIYKVLNSKRDWWKWPLDLEADNQKLAVASPTEKNQSRFSFINKKQDLVKDKQSESQPVEIAKLPKWKQNRMQIVEQILDDIENKNFKWSKVWQNTQWVNAITGNPYTGINIMYLSLAANENKWEDPRFVTFKQAQNQGWKIAKNAKGVRLEKWFFVGKEEELVDPETGKKFKREDIERPICKTFYVFNGADCVGIPPIEKSAKPEYSNEELRAVYEVLKESSLIPIIDDAYLTTPRYIPLSDVIKMPTQKQFDAIANVTPHGQITALAHEMSHSTGHPSRFNRFQSLTNINHFTEDYAKEELVAGFSSIFLQQRMNLKIQDAEMDNDTAYIQSWSKWLKKEPMALFDAIKLAETSADFLYKNYKNTLNQKYQKSQKDNAQLKTAISSNTKILDLKNNSKL